MRKTHLFKAASIIALLAATPAIAQAAETLNANGNTTIQNPHADNAATPDMPKVTEQELREGWDTAKEKAETAVEKVKAALIDDNKATSVDIDTRTTAENLIGATLYDQTNNKLATVEDIILDQDGTARLLVVKDGGLLGLGGKLAAFDYKTVVQVSRDGQIITPLDKSAIDSAAAFSYTGDAKGSKIRMIPDNGFSVAQMLDGRLLGTDGKAVANIDNVAFENGKARHVVAAYGQVLNMGGERVALDFNSGNLVHGKDKVDLKLTAAQTSKLHSLQDTKQ